MTYPSEDVVDDSHRMFIRHPPPIDEFRDKTGLIHLIAYGIARTVYDDLTDARFVQRVHIPKNRHESAFAIGDRSAQFVYEYRFFESVRVSEGLENDIRMVLYHHDSCLPFICFEGM